jgi:hypothetical protein
LRPLLQGSRRTTAPGCLGYPSTSWSGARSDSPARSC